MTTSIRSPIILHADPEHDGLRAFIVLLLVGMLVGGFFIIQSLLNAFQLLQDFTVFFSCIGTLIIAPAIAWVIEQGLKRYWHSGRHLTLHETHIQATNPKGKTSVVAWSDNFVTLKWFFHLNSYPRGGRERRIPNKWICLACQLRQEESRIVAYTYMPPKKAMTLIEGQIKETQFHEINPTDVYDTSFRMRLTPPSRPEIPTKILSSKDGRYWLAERRRWQEGYELLPKDFVTLIHAVQPHQQ